ncbi:MAG TPA: ABC transporter substrate-binding protein [Aggregatilineales bacterium]|nr:ABC transporter substrate-binding protein [Aggregatilineales bacterium]
MNKRACYFISLCLALVLLASGQAGVVRTSAQATQPASAASPVTLKIGYAVWVGYGPLFIARDKGYFADEGLDVQLVKVADPKERFTAIAGGKLDGLVTTLDNMTQYWKTDVPFKAFLALDESAGGDGIVTADDSIQTVKDLKGKQVGVNVGSVSQFFLEYVLQQNGMSGKDVTIVKMLQDDVPAALAAKRIDAGVTWEPNLAKAVQNGARRLITSKDTPGLIVDGLMLRSDVIKANPNAPKGIVNAWYKAIEYWKANPDDADSIMQKGLGGFYEKPDDIKADLNSAKLFDEARNKEFFAAGDMGTATSTVKFAIDFYTKLGIITDPITPADLLDSSYVLPMVATPAAK